MQTIRYMCLPPLLPRSASKLENENEKQAIEEVAAPETFRKLMVMVMCMAASEVKFEFETS